MMSAGSGIARGGLTDKALGVGFFDRGGEFFEMVSV